MVIVPVALAQAMFNTNTLFRILIEAKSRETIPEAKAQALEILKQRHRGEEDVTVITQDAVLATFDRLLGALTMAVAGIAAARPLATVTRRKSMSAAFSVMLSLGVFSRNSILTLPSKLSFSALGVTVML